MREVMIVIRREFLERVRSRAFLIGTIALPIFMVAIFAVPILLERGSSSSRTLVLVDEAPPPVGERFVENLTAQRGENANQYTIERASGSYVALRETLTQRVIDEEIDGYIVLPATVLDDNRVIYRARNVVNQRIIQDLRSAASESVQAERLRRAGLERANVAALTRPVAIDESSITESGESGRGAGATFLFAYMVAFLIYFITAIYGASVLRSVLEEKMNRIAEVLVSSVRASHLMLGKIVGVGSAVLAQVAIWVAAIVVIALRSDLIANRLGIPREAFAALTIPTGQAILFVTYFVLGFLLFAAVFATVGAAMTSEQEAQSVQLPIMLPLFLPLLMSFAITGEPTSTLARVMGLFPLTSPLTMPMRIAAAPIPAWEVALSVVLLALGLAAMAWLGGKIFRIGILSTGKRPTLKEVWVWIREE